MNRSPRTFFNSLYIYVCLPRSIASRPSCLQTLGVRRIPRGARKSSANKLATILDAIVAKNIETSWNRLFHFPSRCLRSPARGGHRRSRGRSLASQVNDAIRRECDDYLPSPTPQPSQESRGPVVRAIQSFPCSQQEAQKDSAHSTLRIWCVLQPEVVCPTC